MMDTIFIQQFKVQTKLGVPAWERILPQTVLLDIEMAYDLSQACISDAIEHTIDYAAVTTRIAASLAQCEFKLVEALAEHVCQILLQEFKAQRVKLTVSKPSILPKVKAVGVSVVRPCDTV